LRVSFLPLTSWEVPKAVEASIQVGPCSEVGRLEDHLKEEDLEEANLVGEAFRRMAEEANLVRVEEAGIVQVLP
jgi:hypothetical protein